MLFFIATSVKLIRRLIAPLMRWIEEYCKKIIIGKISFSAVDYEVWFYLQLGIYI